MFTSSICTKAYANPLSLVAFLCQVKSTVPFSEPFTVDPNNPPAEKDYAKDFESLKQGVTGKEALEAVSV
jgi:hypothetical protein